MPTITIKTDPDDPFSTIVSDQVDWIMKMYVETNNVDYYDGAVSGSSGYVLYDTDGKGTMALLLGGENPYGAVAEIYTIQNGVAERKLSTNDPDARDAMIQMLKTGYLHTYGGWSGTYGYYRFEDGQLKLVVGMNSYGDGSDNFFRVDPTGTERDYFFDFIPDGTEVPITENEFRRLVEKYGGNHEPAELDWKPLAEYGQ